MKLSCKVPRALLPLYTSKKRFKVPYGGRGAGKTQNIAQYVVNKMLSEKMEEPNYLCLRKTQKSLRYSTKTTILKAIRALGVSEYFHTSHSSSEIHCHLNGGLFLFSGCKNVDEAEGLQSLENAKLCWFEECRWVTEDIFTKLTPSIRYPDSELIISFNPLRKSDYVYERFVLQNDPLAEVINVNYYDNPFFYENNALVQEMERDREHEYLYRRVWLGEPGFIENQLIKPEWWKYYDSQQAALEACTGMFVTADTAYKTGTMHDYSVIQCWAYNSGSQLYLIDQVRGKWEFPDLVARVKDFLKKCYNLPSILKPSRCYIEDKSSGIPLVHTLAREGINVIPWKPGDYKFPEDKIGRANESALIISTGVVYIPKNAGWVHDFVTECSEFTDDKDEVGHDDQVDALTMAISIWRWMGGGSMYTRGTN